MKNKTLSIFIDESGDFGSYSPHSPYYIVAMILHDQAQDLSKEISFFDSQILNSGYFPHAIHTGPLIRRESIYSDFSREDRRHLFLILFHFIRKSKIQYTYIKLHKKNHKDIISLTAAISKELSNLLLSKESFFRSFDHIIIYYDNGQIELTKILISVFTSLLPYVEFRKVKPSEYKLFQAADFACTIELLAEKASQNQFSKSEIRFFGTISSFKKDFLKPFRKKLL